MAIFSHASGIIRQLVVSTIVYKPHLVHLFMSSFWRHMSITGEVLLHPGCRTHRLAVPLSVINVHVID
jgi:hypothetical protein